MCTVDRHPGLGTVVAGQVVLAPFGETVADTWGWLPQRYSYVSLDEWCIRPDHFHGILILRSNDEVVQRKTVGSLIGAFKTRSTAQINRVRGTPGEPFWQRDFWDRVIRDAADLDRVRVYIRDNIAAGAWHPGRST
jgi:REP element-mobilizing transposase RayT